MRSTAFAAAAAGLAAVVPTAFAQTYSECNPTNASQFPCPVNAGLNTKSWNSEFTAGKNTSWSYVAPAVNYGSDGAEFRISKRGEAPTIKTDFYIFYGKVEVKMKSAPGQGIISSIVLQSEDLDEIDWEFLGGTNSIVQTNYFGKGNTTTYDRMQQFDVATPQDTVHTYSVDWTKESIVWAIDGTTVRTLNYADANGGTNFPQTPMNIRLGIWAGGDPDNDYWTIQWAGGNTTYDAAAGMPWSMFVEDVKITNYNPGCSYNFTDTTGSSESISINSEGCDLVGTSPTQTSSSNTAVSTGAAAASGSAAAAGAADGVAGSGNFSTPTGSGVGATFPAGSGSDDSGSCAPIIVTQTVTLQPGETAPAQTTAIESTPAATTPVVETTPAPSSTADVDGAASSSVATSTTNELGDGTMTLAIPSGSNYPIPSEPATSDVEGGDSTSTASATTPANTPSATPPVFTGAAAPIALGGVRNALFFGGVAAVLAL
ncbi:glycosidase crf1 [Diplodia corticola]|uniref:Crh-like protein n=1 Tax=Diplodia corticola TaxID=236234 RepID=A0A1J9S544_9PEZI|nr:glycosidase crf1 [Diplodia corticola]OJD35068.1 glycosidase crf1 [Diplodia corticola]